MPEWREIEVGHAERVLTITLNRPERINAWSAVMEAEVRAALEAARGVEDVRAVVLTGAGRGFCAGADMSALSAAAAAGHDSDRPDCGSGDLEQRYSYLLGYPKPIVAAVNGSAAGVGLCLALFCDVRFVAEGAKLTTAFARRGLAAEHGSAWLLPRLIGPMNAADLLLSGRVIDAADAERLGLARRLPADGFLASVQRYAADLANLASPRAIGIIKRQLFEAWTQPLGLAVQTAEDDVRRCRDTDDFREGVAHFVEKRAPAFTGR